MTIKKKLPTMISLLLIIALGITSITAYLFCSRTIEKQSKDSLLMVGAQGSEMVYSLIMGEKKQTELLSENKQVVEASRIRHEILSNKSEAPNYSKIVEANKLLEKQCNKMEFHEQLFIADANGVIFASSNPKTLNLNIGEEEYFKKAMEGKMNVTNTMISKLDGKTIVIFAAPIKDEVGTVIGTLVNSVYVDYFGKYLKNIKVGSTGYAYLVDSTGIILSHPNKEVIMKAAESSVIKEVVESIKQGNEVKSDVKNYVYNGETKVQSYTVVPEVNWILSATRNVSDMNEPVINMLKVISIVTIIAIIISMIIGILISNGITKPINQLVELMGHAADGDLTVTLDIKSKDELGKLAGSFNSMTGKIRELVMKINSSIDIASTTADALVNTSKSTLESVDEVAKTVQKIAEGFSDQSESVATVLDKMSMVGEEIENLNNYSEEMKINSQDVLKTDVSSKAIVRTLFMKTEENDKEVEKVSKIMENLRESSSNIGVIIETISSIADQTNLLALNAAIEAARAGEAGRGFAVVAEEVRKLAEQSANSAKQIEEIIRDIQAKINDAVSIVINVKDAVREQTQSVNETGSIFEKISKNIENITTKIENVNKILTSMNKKKEEVIEGMKNVSASSEETVASSQEVSASIEEQAAAMQELNNAVSRLSSMVQNLSEAIKIFKM
ncbi:methyl-accepting chemotaxis protein [Clostridium sp.]|uniref:methyl-accepting chemotaxis protein n=1 Tax=Clostridium sp. TaxID=1506 RepID=UPI0039F4FEFC